MLDESSLIQNESSKQSKFILSLQPDNVILLSGTPTGGRYERLWSQLHLLGWKISKPLFWKQYVAQEWDEIESQYKIIGYKNVERLKTKMRQHGCHFLKTDEVFDLPMQTDVVID
ncbi:SNF2-related protein, partial [Listeria cossartiae]